MTSKTDASQPAPGYAFNPKAVDSLFKGDSKTLSDICRSLALIGFAVFWIFSDQGDSYSGSVVLHLALIAFFYVLLCDFLQYLTSMILWKCLWWKTQRYRSERTFNAPINMHQTATFFYILKVLSTFLGFCFLFIHFYNHEILATPADTAAAVAATTTSAAPTPSASGTSSSASGASGGQTTSSAAGAAAVATSMTSAAPAASGSGKSGSGKSGSGTPGSGTSNSAPAASGGQTTSSTAGTAANASTTAPSTPASTPPAISGYRLPAAPGFFGFTSYQLALAFLPFVGFVAFVLMAATCQDIYSGNFDGSTERQISTK